MKLSSLALLSSMSLPLLETIGTLQLTNLPSLQQLGVVTPGVTLSSSIVAQDTALTSLDGLNPARLARLSVVGNRFLKTIDMDFAALDLELELKSNSPTLEATFGSLKTAYNITTMDLSTVNFPKLETVESAFRIEGIRGELFSAAALASVGSNLRIWACTSLKSLSFPALTVVRGALSVGGNSALQAIDGFPELGSVGGVELVGNFSRYAMFLTYSHPPVSRFSLFRLIFYHHHPEEMSNPHSFQQRLIPGNHQPHKLIRLR